MNSKSWSHHQVPLTVLKHKLYPPPFGAGVRLITSPFEGDVIHFLVSLTPILDTPKLLR